MIKRVVAGSILSVLLLASQRQAQAGCLSAGEGCLLPRDVTTSFSPDPQCLEIRQELNDCVCVVDLWVKNSCQDPLEAQDFTWNGSFPYLQGFPGPALPRDYEGSVQISAEGAAAGHEQQTFRFGVGADEVSLTVDYDLEHYALDSGCSLAPAGGERGSLAGALPWLALLLMGCSRRRT